MTLVFHCTQSTRIPTLKPVDGWKPTLIGYKPTCLVLVLQGCKGSLRAPVVLCCTAVLPKQQQGTRLAASACQGGLRVQNDSKQTQNQQTELMISLLPGPLTHMPFCLPPQSAAPCLLNATDGLSFRLAVHSRWGKGSKLLYRGTGHAVPRQATATGGNAVRPRAR